MKASRWTEDNEIFATNLKYYVELSNKDQRTICKELGLPEASLSNYLTGKSIPRYKTILMLADYFGISMTDLIKKGDKKEDSEEQKKLSLKMWNDAFSAVSFTEDEMAEIIQFGQYVLSKRK